MSAQLDVKEHLLTEIATSDPWRLEANRYEHLRYALMLNMIRARGPFERALEVGCAAGFFTKLLAPYCRSTHVVDVLPAALDLAAKRTQGRGQISFEVASPDADFALGKTFDLIVVAEVLCYMPTDEALRRAVANLTAKLAPGGLLIFGSAVDATCARWGLLAGAETTMRYWDELLARRDCTSCKGSYWGENSQIAAYTRADGREAAVTRVMQEENLMPHKAIHEIPASSVVVLAPHPDDEVFGCGGAIARHVDRGVPVRVVVATDGAHDASGDTQERRRRRADESRAAATVLGCKEIAFWNVADRTLAYDEALIQRVSGAIAGADLVYAPSMQEVHPDHRALSMAAIEAVRREGRNVRIALYEIGSPLHPNVLVDISDVFEKKRAAMGCFRSQLELQAYDRHVEALNRYRTYTLGREVDAAEAYIVVTAEELVRDPLRFHWPEDEKQAAEAADRALRRTIAAYESSTSWRVTAPLRALSVGLRSFLREGPAFITSPLRAFLRTAWSLLHRAT